MIYKKIIIAFLLTAILSACGASSGEDDSTASVGESNTDTASDGSTQAGLRNYPGSDFSMMMPALWNLVTDNTDIVPEPKNGSIELAVTSTQTTGGFANNMIVLSQQLHEFTTSKDYSIVNNVGAENEYLNYTKLMSKDFSFDDGEKSMIYVFEAKYSELTPVLKFIQTAYVCNNSKAFFLTISLATSIKETSKYEDMLKTFTCK